MIRDMETDGYKKERAIGETFQVEGVKLLVKESPRCHKCYFYKRNCERVNDNITGTCYARGRSDKTDVIFMKIN